MTCYSHLNSTIGYITAVEFFRFSANFFSENHYVFIFNQDLCVIIRCILHSVKYSYLLRVVLETGSPTTLWLDNKEAIYWAPATWRLAAVLYLRLKEFLFTPLIYRVSQ